MPSDAVPDDRVTPALEALAESRADFRSAVAEAIDTVTAVLDSRGAAPEERVARAKAELGAFADGRIDPEGFARLAAVEEALDPATASALRAARETLRRIDAAGDGAFRVAVESGADLRDAVAGAFAGLGRAFAAGRVIEAAVERRGAAAAQQAGEGDVEALPFRAWTAAERALAPPLVVEVDGADLLAGGLAEFMDGAVKIVLVVRGESSPAPLARLVSPSVAVVQAIELDALETVAAAPGPAVAALVADGAARFRHDPAAGDTISDRLAVEFLPPASPRARTGGASAFQQAEEIRLLAALASAGRPEPATDGGAGDGAQASPALPADRLAAWLLSRADLSGVDAENGASG